MPLKIESVEPDAEHRDRGRDRATWATTDGPSPFTLTVLLNGEPVETFPNLDFGAGERNVENVVNDLHEDQGRR